MDLRSPDGDEGGNLFRDIDSELLLLAGVHVDMGTVVVPPKIMGVGPAYAIPKVRFHSLLYA